MKLTVLVPTRGRPENAQRLLAAFQATCVLPDTTVVFGVDADDPARDIYLSAFFTRAIELPQPIRRGMVDGLNRMAATAWASESDYIGFMGDDHCPQTPGWDKALCDAICEQGGGIAYGNDLVHGQNLATACAMDAAIPRTLGYMAPSTLAHLYVDNVWLNWGRGLGKLAYRPDVVIEHLHPLVGKGEWDDGYAAVNAAPATERDRLAYEHYRDGGALAADLEKLRGIH